MSDLSLTINLLMGGRLMSFQGAAVPVERQVDLLLGRMTLDEKLAQLTSHWMRDLLDENRSLSDRKMEQLLAHGIGQITRPGGSSVFDPVSVARAANALQRHLVTSTRLGIPAILHEECCSGYMTLGGTVFPQMIGLAGTFQPELAEQMTDSHPPSDAWRSARTRAWHRCWMWRVTRAGAASRRPLAKIPPWSASSGWLMCAACRAEPERGRCDGHRQAFHRSQPVAGRHELRPCPHGQA